MDDYPLRMTGEPFLDGVLWARGVKHTLNSAEIRVSHLPAEIMDRIEKVAQDAGFEVDEKEVPIRQGMPERRLLIVSPDESELFRHLPRFTDRRLVPGVPYQFLLGYFTACSGVRGMAEFDLVPEDIILTFSVYHDPVTDALEGLASLGVESAETERGYVLLDSSEYGEIPELLAIRDSFLAEERAMREEHGGTPFEIGTGQVLDRVDRQNLTGMVQSIMDRLLLVRELRATQRDGFALLQADRSPIHEQLAWDVLNIMNKPRKQTLNVTVAVLNQVEARYKQILSHHWTKSREYTLCYTMADQLLERIEAGDLGLQSTGTIGSFFKARGPTDEVAAAVLVRGPLSSAIQVEDLGLTISIGTSEAMALRAALEGKMASAVVDSILAFKGLSFDEQASQTPFEVLSRCGSCSEPLVLASGQTCFECSIGLCQTCFVMYGEQQDRPSKFAADQRVAYCKAHANQVKRESHSGKMPRRIRELMRRGQGGAGA